MKTFNAMVEKMTPAGRRKKPIAFPIPIHQLSKSGELVIHRPLFGRRGGPVEVGTKGWQISAIRFGLAIFPAFTTLKTAREALAYLDAAPWASITAPINKTSPAWLACQERYKAYRRMCPGTTI